MSHDLDPLLDTEPSLPNRIVYFSCVAASAAALFVLVSGVHAGGGSQDARMTVAQCWHQIEDQQPVGDALHDMRVACQQLENKLAQATRRHPEALVASQE